MKFVQVCVLVLALFAFMGFAQAYGYYGQQSINSDYYFRGIYHSPSYLYDQSPHWDYYSYNTFTPYPTLGGGSFIPYAGYSYSYAPYVNSYTYAPAGYAYAGYAPLSDFSYRNSGYGCTGFFWC